MLFINPNQVHTLFLFIFLSFFFFLDFGQGGVSLLSREKTVNLNSIESETSLQIWTLEKKQNHFTQYYYVFNIYQVQQCQIEEQKDCYTDLKKRDCFYMGSNSDFVMSRKKCSNISAIDVKKEKRILHGANLFRKMYWESFYFTVEDGNVPNKNFIFFFVRCVQTCMQRVDQLSMQPDLELNLTIVFTLYKCIDVLI